MAFLRGISAYNSYMRKTPQKIWQYETRRWLHESDLREALESPRHGPIVKELIETRIANPFFETLDPNSTPCSVPNIPMVGRRYNPLKHTIIDYYCSSKADYSRLGSKQGSLADVEITRLSKEDLYNVLVSQSDQLPMFHSFLDKSWLDIRADIALIVKQSTNGKFQRPKKENFIRFVTKRVLELGISSHYPHNRKVYAEFNTKNFNLDLKSHQKLVDLLGVRAKPDKEGGYKVKLVSDTLPSSEFNKERVKKLLTHLLEEAQKAPFPVKFKRHLTVCATQGCCCPEVTSQPTNW